jgi:hypothetical protein
VSCSYFHTFAAHLGSRDRVYQKIVESSVLPITKILAIENDKLNSTFLHVVFSSQSLLKPTGDQTGSDTN